MPIDRDILLDFLIKVHTSSDSELPAIREELQQILEDDSDDSGVEDAEDTEDHSDDSVILGNDAEADKGKSPSTKEPEWLEEFTPQTGELVIVDSSVLDDVENPLIDEAIFIPVKDQTVAFEVEVTYDESMLTGVHLRPKMAPNGAAVTKDYEQTAETDEVEVQPQSDVQEAHGVGPGHDTPVQRSVRKHLTTSAKKANKNKRNAVKDPVRRLRGKLNGRTASGQRRNQKRIQRDREENRKDNLDTESVDLAIDQILQAMDTPVSQLELSSIEDKELFGEALDLLGNMALGGWESRDSYITNGNYDLEGNWTLIEGYIEEADLDYDWIYDAKQDLQVLLEQDRDHNLQALVEVVHERRTKTLLEENSRGR